MTRARPLAAGVVGSMGYLCGGSQPNGKVYIFSQNWTGVKGYLVTASVVIEIDVHCMSFVT